MSSFIHSTRLQHSLDRLKAGHDSARAALLEHALERIRRIARRMFRNRRDLHSIEETDDVVQKGLIRLNKALQSVQPTDVRAFFGLAARQIRFVIADLAQKHAHAEPVLPLQPGVRTSSRKIDVADAKSSEPADLLEWSQFHEQIEKLPEEAREMFDLLFYQGLSQAEAATLLEVSERTLRRRWQEARLLLAAAMGGEWPRVE